MNTGYIKLYRKMTSWGWYTETFTKCVFLHLLFMAQYEPCYFKGVSLEKGQVATSIRQISAETNISMRSVRTALEHLKTTQEVTQTTHGKFSVFTIKNYVDYQCTDTIADNQPTRNRHATDKHPYIKEVKKERNKEYSTAFDAFWAAYPRKVAKPKAQTAFHALKPTQDLLEKMLQAISTQKQSEQWTKDGGKFIPHPATWLNQHRWEDTTEEKPKMKVFT